MHSRKRTMFWKFLAVSLVIAAAAALLNAPHPASAGARPPGAIPTLPPSHAGSRNANAPSRPFGQINHFIVIYQENWSFDALYGNFPGAIGYSSVPANAPAGVVSASTQLANHPQIDVFSTPYGAQFGGANRLVPPPINTNVTPRVYDTHFAAFDGTPSIYSLNAFIAPDVTTGDLVHRFHTEQAQIDGIKMDKFVSLSDNPGLVMSGFDATSMPEGLLAQQYVLCDNFFHAAFGGSFLNHHWLIAAQTPTFPGAAASIKQPAGTNSLNGNTGFDSNGNPFNVAKLSLGQSNVNGNPIDSAVTTDGFGVNTLQTVNTPHLGTTNLLPNQTNVTIGDELSAANISWKWYSGGWNDALAGHADPLFQYHHQPFNYYANYADGTAAKAAHLQDETQFFTDLANNTVPSVVFIKPLGPDNEHPGYANLLRGQNHAALLVAAIQNSPIWNECAIIITYDEHGGRFDHVPPPSAARSFPPSRPGTYDRWGPGVRVPAIIISPFAKRGVVDHTEYDTTSILATIEKRFNLAPLSTRDALVNSLENAFDHEPPAISSVAASPASLWPPNNKMVPVTISVTVTDAVDPAPSSKIDSVTSSAGPGDPKNPNWEITGDLTVNLRADKDGGDGRTYTITVRSTDASGNSATKSVEVKVAKDPSGK